MAKVSKRWVIRYDNDYCGGGEKTEYVDFGELVTEEEVLAYTYDGLDEYIETIKAFSESFRNSCYFILLTEEEVDEEEIKKANWTLVE